MAHETNRNTMGPSPNVGIGVTSKRRVAQITSRARHAEETRARVPRGKAGGLPRLRRGRVPLVDKVPWEARQLFDAVGGDEVVFFETHACF